MLNVVRAWTALPDMPVRLSAPPLSSTSNWAAEIRIRAERRMGEMLKEQKAAGGMAKPSGSNQHVDRSHGETDPPKLSDMGITRSMSNRAQPTFICYGYCEKQEWQGPSMD